MIYGSDSFTEIYYEQKVNVTVYLYTVAFTCIYLLYFGLGLGLGLDNLVIT